MKKVLAVFLCFIMAVSFFGCGKEKEYSDITFEVLNATKGAGSGEESENLFDGNPDTKWCVVNFDGAEVIFEANEEVKINGYSFVTGNDCATFKGRNPRAWVISGSDNNEDWDVITTEVKNFDLPDENGVRRDFELTDVEDEYKYFKLEIIDVQSGNCMQISEFMLHYNGMDNDHKNLSDDDEKQSAESKNNPTDSVKLNGPTIPDPDVYFNNSLARSQDMFLEKEGFHCLSFATDYDGQQAFKDYVALLSDPKYQLELTTEKDETVYTVNTMKYGFTYTGKEDVPEIYYEYFDVKGDLLVFIQKNGMSGVVSLSIYYKPDAFEFKDFGDRTTYTLNDLSGNSSSDSNSGSGSDKDSQSYLDCMTCDGSGKCQRCGGSGYLWSSAADTKNRDCPKCAFNKGKCSTCHGSGKR